MDKVDIQEAMDLIQNSGWNGISLWVLPGAPREYNGCLLDERWEPDHRTNLWNHQADPETVIVKLAQVAQDNPK